MDLSFAYPIEANIDKFIREFSIDEGSVVITDDFKLNNVGNYESNIIFADKPTVNDNGFRVGDCCVKIKCKNNYNIAIEEIILEDPVFNEAWGEALYKLTIKLDKIQEDILEIRFE